MKLKVKIQEVLNDPDFKDMMLILKLFGMEAEGKSLETEQTFDLSSVQKVITKPYMDILLASTADIEEAILYSKVVQESALDMEIPVGWPNSEVTEGTEEAPIVRQMILREYAQYFPVDGGYVVRFGDGPGTSGNFLGYPDDEHLRAWVAELSGNYLVQKDAEALIAAYQGATV